jgi:hypothetical protein
MLMKMQRSFIIGLFFVVTLLTNSAQAAPDEYDDSQSNPLRVAAYLFYPVGWLAEWTIFRPFHFLVSATAPQEAFSGPHPHPPVLAEPHPLQDYGLPKKVPLKPAAQPEPQAAAPAAAPETVSIVQLPV